MRAEETLALHLCGSPGRKLTLALLPLLQLRNRARKGSRARPQQPADFEEDEIFSTRVENERRERQARKSRRAAVEAEQQRDKEGMEATRRQITESEVEKNQSTSERK